MKDNELLHNRYPDLFNDQEVTDPALEQLISDLETVYASATHPANLSGQLMSALNTVSTTEAHNEQNDTVAVVQPSESLPERPQIRPPRERYRRSWQRGLSTLVAAMLAALVVSSLLLVLYIAHRPRPGQAGTSSTVTGLDRFLSIHMLNTATGWAQVSNARISAFAVLRTIDGGSHWQDLTPPQMTTPVDDNPGRLYALDAATAWVTGILPQQYPQPAKYHSVLFRTTDAGQTWQKIALPLPVSDQSYINDAHFLNAQIGWITIESRTGKGSAQIQHNLWQTIDGGQTWRNVASSNPVGSRGTITFIDEKTWWLTSTQLSTVVFSHGRPLIYVTHDAGSTWQQRVLPVPPGITFKSQQLLRIEGPQFFSAREGLVIVQGTYIVVYITHDGGDTWQPTTPLRFGAASKGGSYSPASPVFVDMNHGWVYEEVIPFAGMKLPTTNRLIITNDEGQHWITIDVQMPGGQKGQSVSPDSVWSNWYNPNFVSTTAGWLMGYYSPSTSELPHSVLLKTIDGGHTWTIVHYVIFKVVRPSPK